MIAHFRHSNAETFCWPIKIMLLLPFEKFDLLLCIRVEMVNEMIVVYIFENTTLTDYKIRATISFFQIRKYLRFFLLLTFYNRWFVTIEKMIRFSYYQEISQKREKIFFSSQKLLILIKFVWYSVFYNIHELRVRKVWSWLESVWMLD